MNDVISFFIGETETKLGVCMGIAPLGSSIDISMNSNFVKVLLNKYQLKDLVDGLNQVIQTFDFDCTIEENNK